jgi:hypothetical protein
MRVRNLALGSAAALALVAIAGASLAQDMSTTTNSTPQERAQTDTLNTQQNVNDGTTEDGQPGTAADAQYNAQMQQYRDQRAQYEDQKAQYQDRMERYAYDRSHPRDWWNVRYEHATLDGLYSLPRHDLIGKEVDERDGMRLGRIRDVEHASDGRVERVDVALNYERATWIDATDLRYDPDSRVVFTNVSADQIYDRSREGNYDARP